MFDFRFFCNIVASIIKDSMPNIFYVFLLAFVHMHLFNSACDIQGASGDKISVDILANLELVDGGG